MAVNPYLRFNDPEIVRLLEAKNLPTGTEYQRWEGIMSIE
jgi:hydroxyacylglutathione hydrolase